MICESFCTSSDAVIIHPLINKSVKLKRKHVQARDKIASLLVVELVGMTLLLGSKREEDCRNGSDVDDVESTRRRMTPKKKIVTNLIKSS